MAAPHSQAQNPTDAFWALDPFAVVKPDDPWFVNLETLLPREHYGIAGSLRRALGVDDVLKAVRWLGGRRTSSLRPEDLPRAVEIHRTHKVLDTEQDRRMLRTSCVLAYDGTEWWDVHPAIRADELFVETQHKTAGRPSGDG